MQEIIENRALDLTYLEQMVGHNPAFMIEVFDIFLMQTPVFFAELEAATEKCDWKTASNAVHKLKPTFSYIGRDDIQGYAQEMEIDARDLKNLDVFPEKVAQLKRYIQIINQQLEETKASFNI